MLIHKLYLLYELRYKSGDIKRKLFRIFIFAALTLNFIMDYIVTANISLPYQVIYFSNLILLEIVIILWMFTKYKLYLKYPLLILIALYTYFNFADTEIKQAYKIDTCITEGSTWDYKEKKCKTDCISYNDTDGCIVAEEIEEVE